MPHATPIVDTAHSPFAILRPIPPRAVTLNDSFWASRLQRNAQHAIPALFDLLEEHGVLDNFRRLYGASQATRRGYLFSDSDIYKWMEAAAIALQQHEQPAIATRLKRAIDTILPAQHDDGYLNTWFVDERADQRWSDLDRAHELYCAGHLMQAAVAHHRATGDTNLLDCATRFADYIDATFRQVQRNGAPGHPEIEMALVELYRDTSNRNYLELADYFLRQRDASTHHHISGHAVRACYFMAGATDDYLERGDTELLQAITDQWYDMIVRKAYITGAVGPRHTGEAFGNAYELPHERAYAETCAAIGSIFWNWRLLHIAGDARYSDWLERTLYNGFLSGVSLSGTEYFYENPLASDGLAQDDPWYAWARKQPPQRQPWYDCTCCPPNVQRLLASLPGYFYSTSDEGLWVHLFAANTLQWQLADGSAATLVQETNYPWDGEITMRLSTESTQPFALFIRIPEWVEHTTASIDGQPIDNVQPGHYLKLAQTWNETNTIQLSFDMPVQMMVSDDRIAPNRGSVALQRGPLVYCLEGIDHDMRDVRDIRLSRDAIFTTRHDGELLGGVTLIEGSGHIIDRSAPQALYRPLQSIRPPAVSSLALRFLPYYAWANRGPSSMTVWVPLA